MLSQRFLLWVFGVSLMVLDLDVVFGQNYPSRPVRIIAAGSPGGGGDFVARIISQGITGSLGQPVIVDNRPAVIASELVAKAPADGYTVLVYANAFWAAPFFQNVSYDPVKDFSPISLLGSSPNVLVVHPSLPVKSVRELIALAKSKPGQLDYASAETGGSAHLAGELFKFLTGVNIVRIPYKSTTPAIADVSAGRVNLMFANASVAPYLKLGRLRAVAVTSAEPSPLFPGLPTVAASGVPGFESSVSHVAFAPAKTPAAIINRLHQEIVSVLNTPDVKNKFFNTGEEVVGSSPEQLAAVMKVDMVRLGKLIKDAGIRAD